MLADATTTRQVACAALTYDRLVLRFQVMPGEDAPSDEIWTVVAAETSRLLNRSVQWIVTPLDGDDLDADRHRNRQGISTTSLTVWWLDEPIPGREETIYVVTPGLAAVSGPSIALAAAAQNRSLDDVAPGAILHGIGHLVGLVNDGIPMQRNHEGEAKHSADVASVMHHGWHRPETVPLADGMNFTDDERMDLALQEVCK